MFKEPSGLCLIWAEVDSQRVSPRSRKKAVIGGPGLLRLRMYYMGPWNPDSGYKHRVKSQPVERHGGILGDSGIRRYKSKAGTGSEA